MPHTLGGRLERAIAESGQTKRDFAERIGRSRTHVSRWVSGTNLPDVESLRAIVAELGISAHWLLTGDGPMRLGGVEPEMALGRIYQIAAEALGVYATESPAEEVRRIADRVDAVRERSGEREEGTAGG